MIKFFIKPDYNRKLTDLALLVFRISLAGMLLTHGLPKLLSFSERVERFRDPLGIGSTLSLSGAILGEVVAPILVILGLYTRIATIPMAFTMAVAGFIVHADDPFSTKEKSLLFLTGSILLFFTGPGSYSVDGLRK